MNRLRYKRRDKDLTCDEKSEARAQYRKELNELREKTKCDIPFGASLEPYRKILKQMNSRLNGERISVKREVEVAPTK